MALPGCAHRQDTKPEPLPVPVAVEVRDRPPAELLRCAGRPAGIPEDPALVAQIPTPVRAAIIRIARAFALNAQQLDRLIDWSAPGTCRHNASDGNG